MATAVSHSAKKALDDLTECSICSDVFNDPRTLPCIHTYCLECIKGWCRSKPPGVEVDCPLCRKAFVIPVGGVQCLPKNFIVEKLKQITLPTVTVSDRSPCDECCVSNGVPCKKQPAVMHCIDCGKMLCEKCDEVHQTSSSTRAHRREKLDVHSISGPTVCAKHKNKNLELYCEGCQVSLCAICFIESHKSHKCTDIDRVADDFRRLLATNTKSMGDLSVKWSEDLRSLERDREDFLNTSCSVEAEITDRAELLKRIIELDKQRNLKNLSTFQTDRLNEVDSLIGKIKQQLMLMESLKTYTAEMCSKGTSGNIVINATSLRQRAEALMKWDTVSSELSQLNSVSVTFSVSNMINCQNPGSIVGEVALKVTKPFIEKVDWKKVGTTSECFVIPVYKFIVVYSIRGLCDGVLFTSERHIVIKLLLFSNSDNFTSYANNVRLQIKCLGSFIFFATTQSMP